LIDAAANESNIQRPVRPQMQIEMEFLSYAKANSANAEYSIKK